MREIKTEDLRATQIKILNTFQEFCLTNKLKWWIDSGTLLGAVRHGGYIPWDDDIDVSMLRQDYEKAIEKFNDWSEKNKMGRFQMIAPEIGNNYYYPFGKIIDTKTVLYEQAGKQIEIGVYIDVFAYDNAPSDKSKYYKMLHYRDFLGKLRRVKMMGKGRISLKRLRVLGIKVLLLPVSVKAITMKILSNAKRYKNVNTGKIGDFLYPYGGNDFFLDADFFDDLINIKFEDGEYPAPSRYDEWLRLNYGDYMQIPPKEKQIRHSIKAYYKDA